MAIALNSTGIVINTNADDGKMWQKNTPSSHTHTLTHSHTHGGARSIRAHLHWRLLLLLNMNITAKTSNSTNPSKIISITTVGTPEYKNPARGPA